LSIMTDFDSIWRTQDEIRTVVNAVLGECIWNLSYNERRMAIELELTQYPCNGVSLDKRLVPRGCDQRPKLHKNLQFSNTKQQKSHKKG